MSQRIFRDGRYEVWTGWDRPLQYHFLNIYDHTEDDDSLVYCNLDDPTLTTGGMTLSQVFSVLERFGIRYPPTLPNDLQTDREQDAGGAVKVHY
jgi:hypothetical protein